MRPRSNPDYGFQAGLFTLQDKSPQIIISGKIELTFYFLMINPEHIGGYHSNPAGFHFAQLFIPVIAVIS
ncbi:hypothetical protein D3C86_2134290 [compost metagenome]